MSLKGRPWRMKAKGLSNLMAASLNQNPLQRVLICPYPQLADNGQGLLKEACSAS